MRPATQCSPRFGCGRQFSSDTAFQKHLQGTKYISHVDPNGVKELELGADGVTWRLADLDGTFDFAQRERKQVADKPCVVCGGAVQLTGKRGRPPTKCEDCR